MNFYDITNEKNKTKQKLILTAFEFVIWDDDDWVGYSESLKLSSESVSLFVDWFDV
jgi:hypothetical protein